MAVAATLFWLIILTGLVFVILYEVSRPAPPPPDSAPTHPVTRPRTRDTTPDEPDGIATAQLERINELTRTARTSWFAQLSFFAFIGVTLLGVRDAHFFFADVQTQLPLIGLGIPTYLFFSVAPLLGAVLFAYFHQHLLKLWEALGEADETIGGTPLSDRILPWLISDFALSFRRDKSLRPRPMQRLAHFVSVLLAFAGAPIVLAAFWWRSMPAHDEVMTILFCGPPLLASLYTSFVSWRRMRETASASYVPTRFTRWWATMRWRRGLLVLALLSATGWLRTEGELHPYVDWVNETARDYRIDFRLVEEEQDDDGKIIWTAWWADLPFDWALARANLREEVFVTLPADWRDYDAARDAYRVDWCKARGMPAEICGPGKAKRDDEMQAHEIDVAARLWQR